MVYRNVCASAVLAPLALLVTSISAQAFVGSYEKYYCTEGNPFTNGMSSKNSFTIEGDTRTKTDLVRGVFGGKSFKFEAVETAAGSDTWKWADKDTGMIVSVQVPDPYSGLQDALWGEVKSGSVKKSLNCFLSAH